MEFEEASGIAKYKFPQKQNNCCFLELRGLVFPTLQKDVSPCTEQEVTHYCGEIHQRDQPQIKPTVI